MFDLATTSQPPCWSRFKQPLKQLPFCFEVPPPKPNASPSQARTEPKIGEDQIHFPKLSTEFFSNGRTADVLSKLDEYIATYPKTPQLYAFR